MASVLIKNNRATIFDFLCLYLTKTGIDIQRRWGTAGEKGQKMMRNLLGRADITANFLAFSM